MQSSMYYLSRWEEVIYYSTNPRESVRLLKLIALAIEVNYKPFYLTGLSYFQVSTQTVLKVKKTNSMYELYFNILLCRFFRVHSPTLLS